MRKKEFLIPVVSLFLVPLFCGCVVSQSDAPVLRKPIASELPSVGLRGFVGHTVDVNPTFGTGSSSISGSVYGPNGSANFYGVGSTSYAGVEMRRRETSATRSAVCDAMLDMGFPMPEHPDFVLKGTYYGPCTDWGRWYVDAAVDVFSLTFLMNVRQKTALDVRILDAKTGRQLAFFREHDSYRFTTFGFVPLFGHLFCPMQQPNNFYARCNERVTVKGLNDAVDWLKRESEKKKDIAVP